MKQDCYNAKGVLQYKRAELEAMARVDPNLPEFHPVTKGSKTHLKHTNAADLCRKLGLMGAYVPAAPAVAKEKKCAARATKKFDIFSKAELVEQINAARKAVDPDTDDLLTIGKANKITYDQLCKMVENGGVDEEEKD